MTLICLKLEEAVERMQIRFQKPSGRDLVTVRLC